jgi:hypothetical protein
LRLRLRLRLCRLRHLRLLLGCGGLRRVHL